MGHHHYSDTFPFAIHLAENNIARQVYEVLEGQDNIVSDEVAQLTDMHGWAAEPCGVAFAKHGDDSDVWELSMMHPGGFHVALVNESEYSNADYYEIAVVANSRASIQKFLDDFGIVLEDWMKIEENESVNCSW